VKRTPKGRAQKKRPSRSLSKSLRKKRGAIQEIGAKNVRRGPIMIGRTRWLTPTKRGFDSLRSFLLERQRSSKKAEREAFTFGIEIRHKMPNGKVETIGEVRGGFPRLQDARRRRRKGETQAAAFRRITELEIRKAIFRVANEVKDRNGKKSNTDELRRELQAKFEKTKLTKEQQKERVKRYLVRSVRKMKQARALTFRLRVDYVHT
jgi:hypothetical protein